jgi:hypothetical protein
MKTYGGVDVYIHVFLTSALVGCEWSASRPGRFTSAERAPDTQWIGGWVGLRAVCTAWKEEKSCPYRDSNPDPYADDQPIAQSLHRLRYPGFNIVHVLVLMDVVSGGWKCFHDVIHSLRNLSHACLCCRATRNLWLHNAPSYQLFMFHWNSLSRSFNEAVRFITRRRRELVAPYWITQCSSHAWKMSSLTLTFLLSQPQLEQSVPVVWWILVFLRFY